MKIKIFLNALFKSDARWDGKQEIFFIWPKYSPSAYFPGNMYSPWEKSTPQARIKRYKGKEQSLLLKTRITCITLFH